MVLLLVVAFALSLLGLLSLFAYLTLGAPGAIVEQVGAARGLWLMAGLAGCVSLTSGLLAFHYKFEGYSRGAEVLFRTCLIVSTGILLCSGVWACAIALFG